MTSNKKFRKYSRRFYFVLEKYSSQRPHLRYFLRIIRFIVFIGPWRHLFVKYFQRFPENKPMPVNTIPFFPGLDVAHIVHDIEKHGYSMGINLSEKEVGNITSCYKDPTASIYWDPHKKNKTIFDISHNSTIIEIARKYIGTEPILHSSVLKWSLPKYDSRGSPLASSQQGFHYDVGDFRSLNVFIYLTDTDRDCGPHVVIENTHKYKSPLQFIKHTITDTEAHRKYGEQIQVITGSRGTVFFEDCRAFHKQMINAKPRLMLNLVYLMRRQPGLTQRFRGRFVLNRKLRA